MQEGPQFFIQCYWRTRKDLDFLTGCKTKLSFKICTKHVFMCPFNRCHFPRSKPKQRNKCSHRQPAQLKKNIYIFNFEKGPGFRHGICRWWTLDSCFKMAIVLTLNRQASRMSENGRLWNVSFPRGKGLALLRQHKPGEQHEIWRFPRTKAFEFTFGWVIHL